MENYFCDECQLPFSSSSLFANHFRWRHKQNKDYKCDKCNTSFKDKSSWSNHVKYCNGPKIKKLKEILCSKCGNFISSKVYKIHYNSCNGLGPRRLRRIRKYKKVDFTQYKSTNGLYICDKCNHSFPANIFVMHIEKCHLTTENIKKIKSLYYDNVPIKIIRQQNGFTKRDLNHVLKNCEKRNMSDVIKRSHKEGRMCKRQFHESFAEKFFNNFLQTSGYKLNKDYIREYRVSFYRIDFFFQNLNVAIEIDGSQHYRYNHQKEIDKRKDELLNNLGVEVIRLPWKVVCNESKSVLNEVLEVLKKRTVCSFNEKLQNKLLLLNNRKKENINQKKESITTTKQIKRKTKKQIEKLIIVLNKVKSFKIHNQRLQDLQNIDLKKWGSISKLANLWNVSHTQVRRFIRENT